MAYQPKSYKKFVATAATATLVATAIVPVASAADAKSFKDVSKTYQEAVNYLVTNNIAQGKSDTMFGTSATITRGDAAVMIAKALKLDTAKAPSAGFKDVNKRVAGAVNALVDAKILSGKTATTFAPDANITRQEMAKIIANAYKLNAGTTKNNFKDVNSNWDAYVDALVANEITFGKTGTTFAPTASVTRGEFALFVYRSETLIVAPTVTTVTAVNGTTISLTGQGLRNMKAEDVKVQNNTISSFVVSDDGTTATIKVNTALVLDQEYTVTVTTSGVANEFKVKYTMDSVKTAEVVAGTFDDDTKGQRVGLKVNGSDADFNALRVAGYTVKYVAVSTSNDTAAAIFQDDSTGLLKDAVAIGDYTVQVTVNKGSSVVVSPKQTIKVRNLELAATRVGDYTLVNSAVAGPQKSTTFQVGEAAQFTELVAFANNTEFDVTDPTKIKVASSNPAVVSVANGILSANTPGTTQITISYGDVSKVVAFTVTNDARVLAKVTPSVVGTTIIKNKTSNVTLSAVDQFGDLMNAQAITVGYPSNAVVSGPASVTTSTNGKIALTLTAAAAGNGVVLFKDVRGNTLGTVNVKVTEVDNVGSSKLEIIKDPAVPTESSDNALDLSADNTVIYNLAKYTTENVPNGTQALNTYTVKYNADVLNINGASVGAQEKTIGAANLTITAKAVGSSNVAVYDTNGVLVSQVNITVTNSGYSISTVAFKAVPTIDYKNKNISAYDVLDITASAGDDIVKGITLSKPTAHVIRIVETAGTQAKNTLYIDADGNGAYTAGEDVLGTLQGTVASGATGLVAGNFDALAGVTTANTGDAGTVIFKVLSGSNILASTSVSVKVK